MQEVNVLLKKQKKNYLGEKGDDIFKVKKDSKLFTFVLTQIKYTNFQKKKSSIKFFFEYLLYVIFLTILHATNSTVRRVGIYTRWAVSRRSTFTTLHVVFIKMLVYCLSHI